MIIKKKTIHGGIPIVAGTRVPVSVLLSYALEKDGLKRAKQEFPQLSARQILAAWEYAEQKIFTSVHGTTSQI